MNTPQEIIKLYADGVITGMEMNGLLQNIITDDNIADALQNLARLKNPERLVNFIEDMLGLIGAIDNGERIMQWNGPDLTKDECQNLRARLACLIRYLEA